MQLVPSGQYLDIVRGPRRIIIFYAKGECLPKAKHMSALYQIHQMCIDVILKLNPIYFIIKPAI